MIWLCLKGVDSMIAHFFRADVDRAVCGVPGFRGVELCARRCFRCERSVRRTARRTSRSQARSKARARVLPGQLPLLERL